MSILDDIANPKTPNFLEGLRLMENIETSKTNRRIAEIQAGRALQKMQAEREAQKQQSQGMSAIRDYYSQNAPTSTTTVPTAQAATPPTGTPAAPTGTANVPNGKTETGLGAISPQAIQSVLKIPTDQLNNVQSLDQLVGTLAANPQMAEQAKMFSTMANQAREHLQKQSAEKIKEGEKISTIVGGMFEGVSRLEDAGDMKGAQAQWQTVMNFINKDPTFQGNEDVQKFIKAHQEYRPGAGKLMLLSTMTGIKARDQLQQEQQMTETARHNRATEAASAEKLSLKEQIKTLKENKPESFKSSDANAIYRFAVGFHGGLMDENGNLKLLDPNKTKDVQELSAKAADLYATGKAKTHNEAISMAAEQLKMESKWPWQETSMTGASKPMKKVDISNINQKSIDYLKANPDQLKAFNEKYGEGAGESVLGQ
jgi:hypothetical protein